MIMGILFCWDEKTIFSEFNETMKRKMIKKLNNVKMFGTCSSTKFYVMAYYTSILESINLYFRKYTFERPHVHFSFKNNT